MLFLKISQNSQENMCVTIFFLINLRLRSATFLEMRFQHRCLPVDFPKYFRTPFLQKTFVGCFCSKYSYIYVLFLVKCIICKGVVSSETFHICATSYFVFAKLVKPFPRIMFFLVPSIIIMKKVLKNHINSSVSPMIHFLVQLSTRMLLMDFIIMMQLSLK